MFQCYVMTGCSLPASKPEMKECDDYDTVEDLTDEDYGCCDCGTKRDLELVEISDDLYWLQCQQCAWESFCEGEQSEHYNDLIEE